MRRILTTATLIVALSAPGAIAVAAQGGRTSGKTTPKSTHSSKQNVPASHAATGIVQSINDTSLVISRRKVSGRPMTFLISPSTERKGIVAVGSPVSVRYHADGKTLVATAITAQASRQQTSRTPTPKKSS